MFFLTPIRIYIEITWVTDLIHTHSHINMLGENLKPFWTDSGLPIYICVAFSQFYFMFAYNFFFMYGSWLKSGGSINLRFLWKCQLKLLRLSCMICGGCFNLRWWMLQPEIFVKMSTRTPKTFMYESWWMLQLDFNVP